MKNNVAIAVLALFAFAVAAHADRFDAVNAAYIKEKTSEAECRVTFTKAVLDVFAPYINQSNDLKAKLDSGLLALKSNIAWENHTNARAQLQTDLKEAILAINGAKQTAKNETNETLTQIRTQIKAAQEDFVGCRKKNVVKEAQAFLAKQKEIAAYEKEVIANLTANGANTTALEKILQLRQERVIAPLEAAIASGNVTLIQETFEALTRRYANMWARFHTARMSAVVEKLESELKQKNRPTEWEAAKNGIEKVRGLMRHSQALTEKEERLGISEEKQVENDLKEAKKEMLNMMRTARNRGGR